MAARPWVGPGCGGTETDSRPGSGRWLAAGEFGPLATLETAGSLVAEKRGSGAPAPASSYADVIRPEGRSLCFLKGTIFRIIIFKRKHFHSIDQAHREPFLGLYFSTKPQLSYAG
jgi:hypothetical protein